MLLEVEFSIRALLSLIEQVGISERVAIGTNCTMYTNSLAQSR